MQSRLNRDAPEQDVTHHLAYRRAIDDSLLDEIYALRYRCYHRDNTIESQPDERFTDPHDRDPNAFIFALELNARAVASIRLHLCGPAMQIGPGLGVFSQELEPLLSAGESFVDPTRFVVDTAFRRALGALPFATVRLAAMAAEHFRTDYVLATVRAPHVPFYRRFCDLELWSEPRDYPGLARPICLMGGRSDEIRRSVYARQGEFASNFRERATLFGLSRRIGPGMGAPSGLEGGRVSVSAFTGASLARD